MEWKLFDRDKNFIQEVNCQYDSLDIATFDNNATQVLVNFEKKEAYIIATKDDDIE